MLKQLFGHMPHFRFFEGAIATGRLSHAYLLVGDDGVGKRALAEMVIARLFAVETYADLLRHPDFFRVVREEDEKKDGALKKSISLNQIDKVRAFLHTTPNRAPYKVVTIDDASDMSPGACNGLLKTLEEPPKRALVFLLTDDPRNLSETVRSRCQTLFFSRVAEDEIASFLVSRYSISAIDAADIAHASGGLPGKAIAYAADPDVFPQYRAEREEFLSLFGKPLYRKREILAHLFEDKEQHIAAREVLVQRLRLWQTVLRDMYVSGSESLSRTVFLDVMNRIPMVMNFLTKNVHPKLLVEHILVALP